jgi:hypothetical protein
LVGELANRDRDFATPSHIAESERECADGLQSFERAERDRIKKAKKDEKLKRQQERAALHPVPDLPENPTEHVPRDE